MITLKAEKRNVFGRKVKKLRKEGFLPASVYGRKVKSEALQVLLSDFLKVYKEVGETSLIELSINGSKKPVLVKNLQLDPVSDNPLHVDFLQVDLKEKVTTEIPIELTGESPAEKQGLGTVVQYINEVEVEALPTDLPEKFVVDISNLASVDDAIQVKNLKIYEKVEIKEDPEVVIAKVEPPKKEEEVVVPTETPPEGGEVKPSESEGEGDKESEVKKVEETRE